MACLPLNPDKDFWKTMNFMGKLKLIYPTIDLKFRFYTPIAKTELYDMCIRKGFQPIQTMDELIKYFSKDFSLHYVAPWVKKNYYKYSDNFHNFYYLFADPFYYKKFKKNKRTQMFIINMVMYPLVYFRFHFNFMKFHFEIKLFKKIVDNCNSYKL
jgi:hypothetical protein